MRLIHCENTGSLSRLEEFERDSIPRYAILSHTWGDDEVSFQDFMNGSAQERNGYAKILFCAKQARLHGLYYIWVDTCCIDKTNSTELQEAINSMFHWYRNAEGCYAYLGDVQKEGASSAAVSKHPNPGIEVVALVPFSRSRWFKRGWTLQELLAPKNVEFFSAMGEKLGDRKSLEQQIHYATGIPVQALHDGSPGRYPARERFQWMAGRQTKKEEDMAYALFGIFGVMLPLLYGEGKERAEKRLRDEILRNTPYKTIVSQAVGGVGGKDFECVAPEGISVHKLILWSSGPGRHFQALRVTFSDGKEQSAGRPYGNNKFVQFEFRPGERIREASLWDNHDGNRLGTLTFVTTMGRQVELGHSRRNETVIRDTALYDFVGFRGKATRDIDRLAFVFRYWEEI